MNHNAIVLARLGWKPAGSSVSRGYTAFHIPNLPAMKVYCMNTGRLRVGTAFNRSSHIGPYMELLASAVIHSAAGALPTPGDQDATS